MRTTRVGPLIIRDFSAPEAGRARPRILAIKLDHFGDYIMTLPAFRRLRQGFADAHITLVCGSWNRDLARASGLFDEVRTYDLFPQNAKGWNGIPIEPPEKFDVVAAGRFDLAIDLRVDADTRFLLQRVDARLRAGIGATARFPYLDIALPMAHQPWEFDPRLAMDVLAMPADMFVSQMSGRQVSPRGEPELVHNFFRTNCCLVRSPAVALPLARCRVTFAVGLTGRGFGLRQTSMIFSVMQNGQLLVEKTFDGREMNFIAGGQVTLGFESAAENGRFEFRIDVARRPLFGRFVFRGMTVEASDALVHPRWLPSELHIGEKISLLVALAQERMGDLYGDGPAAATAPSPEVIAAFDGPDPHAGTIAIAPFSNSTVRDWPLANYAALVTLLLAALPCRIALVGTAAQAAALEALVQPHAGTGRVVSLAGRTAWSDMPALLRRARLVVCNNSGVAHVAAAHGAATLAIYSGSHQSQEWGPRGRRARALMMDVLCSPCGYEVLQDCEYGHACMTRMTPAIVCGQAVEMVGLPVDPAP